MERVGKTHARAVLLLKLAFFYLAQLLGWDKTQTRPNHNAWRRCKEGGRECRAPWIIQTNLLNFLLKGMNSAWCTADGKCITPGSQQQLSQLGSLLSLAEELWNPPQVACVPWQSSCCDREPQILPSLMLADYLECEGNFHVVSWRLFSRFFNKIDFFCIIFFNGSEYWWWHTP